MHDAGEHQSAGGGRARPPRPDWAGSPVRRVLITGLSSHWGGGLAQELERVEEIDAIVGVDSEEPTRELTRTEFVQTSDRYSLLERIVEAAQIDTVVDARLTVDPLMRTVRDVHESNVVGTVNVLAACSGPRSPVRRFVFRSSAHYYGCSRDDPAFFSESMRRAHPPATRIESDVVEAEAAVSEYAERHPDVRVSVLRCANVLGPGVRTSHTWLLGLPAVPMILGFDPRYQFVAAGDVVRALEHAIASQLEGVYNVAADGVLALSEVISLLGKRPLPVLPPVGTGALALLLRGAGMPLPAELVHQLRYGRGLDNRKLKATGFEYELTTREAVLLLAEQQRVGPLLRGSEREYEYERHVEEFLRRSPLVRDRAPRGSGEHEPFGI